MRCGKRFTISAVVTLLFAAPAAAAPNTTVERTIFDCDGDNLLDLTFGEQHLSYDDAAQREQETGGDPCSKEFGEGERLRLGPSASIVTFLQLSDFQVVDEESPARVEFLDSTQRVPAGDVAAERGNHASSRTTA